MLERGFDLEGRNFGPVEFLHPAHSRAVSASTGSKRFFHNCIDTLQALTEVRRESHVVRVYILWILDERLKVTEKNVTTGSGFLVLA